MNKMDKAIEFAMKIAKDDSHGYDQVDRMGAISDFDCSGLVITATEKAGIKVKKFGATTTSSIKKAYLKAGFSDVTKLVDGATGKGLEKNDILLHEGHHVAFYIGDGKLVHASINENGKTTGGKDGDQTGKEICIRSYYNHPWNCVLRYDK